MLRYARQTETDRNRYLHRRGKSESNRWDVNKQVHKTVGATLDSRNAAYYRFFGSFLVCFLSFSTSRFFFVPYPFLQATFKFVLRLAIIKMAKTKESTTPKAKEAKETKPAKAGIAKRTPVRALPVKLSRAKSVVPSEDMLFMWKIMQVSVMEVSVSVILTISVFTMCLALLYL